VRIEASGSDVVTSVRPSVRPSVTVCLYSC